MSGALTVMNDAVLRPALWFPITVRVAWELHLGGVGVRSNVLEAARFHVFSHLPDDVPVHIAERLASIYSIDFIQRLREQKYRRPVIDPDIDMDVPVRWRQLFLSRLKEGDREVYWFYFSDGLSVERTAQKLNQKQRSVENRIRRIRSFMRKIVAKDEMDLQAWSDTRVNQLVRYVSNLADEQLFERFSENPGSLLSSEGKKAADRCPRLRRAYLLLKHGIVSERELETPDDDTAAVTRDTMLLLALHPDARSHADQIDQYVGDYALKLSADTWLVEQEQVGHTEEVLRLLAEQNSPPRHMLRGAKVQGPAEWFGKVLLGPLPIRAVDTVRTRPWGDIDGISDLPLPLPPPPSAIKAWAIALAMLLIGVFAWRFAINSEVRENPFALDAEFYVTPQAVDVRFDVDDQAWLSVVTYDNGVFNRVAEHSPATKGRFATGDGRYYLRVDAPQIAIVSSHSALENISVHLASAQSSADPIPALKQQLLANYEQIDVIVSPLIRPEGQRLSGN